MRTIKTIFALATLVLVGLTTVNAQEEESSSVFDAGADVYSSYIWRGSKFGTGPAFQPWVSAAVGGLEIGAWGSVNAGSEEALEMDLYVSYGLGPVSITVTDYYFGGDWTEFGANHYIEPSIGLSLGGLSLTGAFMLLPGADAVDAVEAVAGSPATVDMTTGVITPAVEAVEAVEAAEEVGYGEEMDLYFEAGYTVGAVDLALGVGNGAYTAEGDFGLCNLTVGTSKEIKITDSFSLPLSGAVTLNPSTGGFFISAGVSF